MFNKVRRQTPVEFFQIVGYVFVPWHKVKMFRSNKDHMTMEWVLSYESAKLCVAEDIPDVATFTDDDPEAMANNKELYNNFAQSRPETQLLVEHVVLVRAKGR